MVKGAFGLPPFPVFVAFSLCVSALKTLIEERKLYEMAAKIQFAWYLSATDLSLSQI